MTPPTLMHGDCLDLMDQIPGGAVDLICADLPYGTTACDWDVVIPFAPLWDQLRRVLKPGGTAVFTSSQPFTTDLIASNRKWFKYEVVWEKANGTNFLNAKYQPMKVHETVVVFSPMASTYSPRGSMTYNPQMEQGEPWTRSRGRVRAGGMTFHAKPELQGGSSPDGLRYPRSVVRFHGVNDTGSDRHGHGTQKPTDLMDWLIRTYSNPGDLVLDPTMGSGTTGVSAIANGRRFIGIEADATHFATSQRRINEVTPLLEACL